MGNKAYKSGLSPGPIYVHSEELEIMEHLLFAYRNYSAKIWALASHALALALSRHARNYSYIPAVILGHYLQKTFIFLFIQDGTTRKVLILFLQEARQDIIF